MVGEVDGSGNGERARGKQAEDQCGVEEIEGTEHLEKRESECLGEMWEEEGVDEGVLGSATCRMSLVGPAETLICR